AGGAANWNPHWHEGSTMPPECQNSFLCLSHCDALHRIRDTLDEVGYTEARVLEVLGYAAMPSQRTRQQLLPLLLRRTSGSTPLETLIRFFLLGVPTDIGPCCPPVLEDCSQTGLVLVSDGKAFPQVSLSPYEGLIVGVDWTG